MTITLLMDKRECQKRVAAIKSRFKETVVKTEDTTLDVCDYIVKNDDVILFGIEWKTYDDFVSSMKNNHLTSQLVDMEGMEHPYLFIVGNYWSWKKTINYKTNINVTREQIAGFLTSIAGRYKTKVIHYESTKEAIEGILHLAKIHTEEGVQHTQIKLPERVTRSGNPNIDMYLALPGIGLAKCKAYSNKIKFSDFVNTCKYDSEARTTFNNKYAISVPQKVIDYCREL